MRRFVMAAAVGLATLGFGAGAKSASASDFSLLFHRPAPRVYVNYVYQPPVAAPVPAYAPAPAYGYGYAARPVVRAPFVPPRTCGVPYGYGNGPRPGYGCGAGYGGGYGGGFGGYVGF